MPAFGLDGPWRDRPGYAQTMEQVSGMAWTTGFPDGPPTMPNGQVDPVGGNFALVGLLNGLEQRRITGRGVLVECPLVLGALNLAAEQVIEYSATGQLIGRLGNRDPRSAAQGVYPCSDTEEEGARPWVAISVMCDREWQGLRDALGRPDWAMDATLGEAERRRVVHDDIDRHLSQWCQSRSSTEVVDRLWARGVPVAAVLIPHEQYGLEQLHARGFFEHVEHNKEVLGELGYNLEELSELEDAGVIGTRPRTTELSHGGPP